MDDFTGTTCGNNVKYPLIGAMREELLGVSRGKDAKDVDWEKVAASFEDLPVSFCSNISSFVILIANDCRKNQSQSKSMFLKFYRKSPRQKRKSTRKSSKDKPQSKQEVLLIFICIC